MSVPDKFIDKNLYRKIKANVFKNNPINSAYRSMEIVKQYKARGGKVKADGKISNLDRWIKEKWINVFDFLKNNKTTKCGDDSVKNKNACRPSKRIDKDTPITIKELLKIHSKDDILKAVEKKNRDSDNLILKWKTLNVIARK